MALQLFQLNMRWLDKIIENVYDPSWWFTALFIAIIASLLAAYIKDLLGRLLSRLSLRFKVWWQIRRVRGVITAITIASDTHKILFLILKIAFYYFWFLFTSFFFCFVAIMRDIRQDYSFLPQSLLSSLSIFIILTGYNIGVETIKIIRVRRISHVLNWEEDGVKTKFKKSITRRKLYRSKRNLR